MNALDAPERSERSRQVVEDRLDLPWVELFVGLEQHREPASTRTCTEDITRQAVLGERFFGQKVGNIEAEGETGARPDEGERKRYDRRNPHSTPPDHALGHRGKDR